MESVLPGTTGFLCEPTPAAFATAMLQLLNPSTAQAMGGAARAHVISRWVTKVVWGGPGMLMLQLGLQARGRRYVYLLVGDKGQRGGPGM